ncbi:MAG: hypothetical protein GVY36_02685 [Verrucomicrobia bacterium]|jgi:hypothetical protein|nr:hypothetical protein [Verrucomicrobiota bacterium]
MNLVMPDQHSEYSEIASDMASVRRSYVAPTAQWHDLKVITLGGVTGFDDSGCVDCQDPQNGASGYNGDRSGGNPGGP